MRLLSKKVVLWSVILGWLMVGAVYTPAQAVVIQENEIGFCHVDGAVLSDVSGFTGIGYADSDRGVGKSMSWCIHAETTIIGTISWRYANGGGSGDRTARLLINGTTALEEVNFPHTGAWTQWVESAPIQVEFVEGENNIRIEAYSPDGLANIDYLQIEGEGLTPVAGLPWFTLNVTQNDPLGGIVTFEPNQPYYKQGTSVKLQAQAHSGYIFQSWSGDVTSAEPNFTFAMEKETSVSAIFLPEGIQADPNLVGYATVQDDAGTPYWVIGGALGPTVDVNTLEDLKLYLGSPDPYVVRVSGLITATDDQVKVTSHKSLLGADGSAHLKGIELEINGARNVIVKNLKVSHVVDGDIAADAIVITGQSKNVWIDHCELFSDRDHDKDYYDGLLDIKNESAFITISRCSFHDHFKTCLISSGDDSVNDTAIRVTFHHNLFYNCGSRLPSIRFGRAHVFNNLYLNCDSAVNSRMGACVRVEKNVFKDVGTAVRVDQSLLPGQVEMIDNLFDNAGVGLLPPCELVVPYGYAQVLHEVVDVPEAVMEDLGVSIDQGDYSDPEPPPADRGDR